VQRFSLAFYSVTSVSVDCGSLSYRVPILVGGRSPLGDDEDSDGRLSLNDVGDELTISGVRRSDASTYSCRAFNNVGAATRTYTLVVQGPTVYYVNRQRTYYYYSSSLIPLNLLLFFFFCHQSCALDIKLSVYSVPMYKS